VEDCFALGRVSSQGKVDADKLKISINFVRR